MSRFLFALFVICICGTAIAVPARVDYIVDGDTFSGVVQLKDGAEISVRVRLRNVDTPEIKGECEHERDMAQRAKEKLGKIIPVGTIVELNDIKDDKYLGRIDATVADARGHDVGRQLIRAGLGRGYNGGRRRPWCEKKLAQRLEK